MDPDTATVRRRPARAKLVLASVVLLVLAVLGALGLDWWRHPSVFGGLGDGFEAKPRPVGEAGFATTVVFPATDGEPETVTMRGAEAVFSTNTAQATATFSVCHMSPGEIPILVSDNPDRDCADIEPFEPGMELRHHEEPDADYLMVTITPTRRGVAELERVELDYRRGADHLFQQGTESIEIRRRVTAT